MQIDTVLTRYAPASGNRPAKVWDQNGDDYAIWDDTGLFETLKATLGHPIRLTFDSKPSQDGRFQNRRAQASELLNGMGSVTTPVTPIEIVQTLPGFTPTPPETAPTGGSIIEYQRAKHPDEQAAIRRAVALNATVATLPCLDRKISKPEEMYGVYRVYLGWLEEGS